MKKSNSNAVSAHPIHPELPTMSIPLIDEPSSWPHQEDDHPPAPVGQSDQQRHGLQQACDWYQCDLSEWWKHNENEAHTLSMKATTIMAGPAIRKRRKLERRKLSNGLAWWNAWWRRMEVMAAFERDNLILEKMKIKNFLRNRTSDRKSNGDSCTDPESNTERSNVKKKMPYKWSR